MSKSKLVQYLVAALMLVASSGSIFAHDMVAGGIGIKGGEQSIAFTPYDAKAGVYNVVITKPTGVFFEDPGVSGIVAQKDTNPQRKGDVWVVPYSKAPALFEGSIVHVCKLQGEWTCGSGQLDKILTGDAKSYASGTVKDGVATITLKPSAEAVAKFAADKKYDRSIEGFTLIIIPPATNAKRAWLAINPETQAKAANGSPTAAWVVNLATGIVAPFATVKDGQNKFAAVIKQ